MKIFIAGAGKMGSWLCHMLAQTHELMVHDPKTERLDQLQGVRVLRKSNDIAEFQPDMFINAASLQHTMEVFKYWLPMLPSDCLLVDIASVKNGLEAFYLSQDQPFVSLHPMFGPTFARMNKLEGHHLIVISESDEKGKRFFNEFFSRFGLLVHELSFDAHDQTIAYSLTIPFVSTLVFGACMSPQQAPGTTFRKHLAIAEGLMAEDNQLLCEILFNKHSLPMIERVITKMKDLRDMMEQKKYDQLVGFFEQVRHNIALQ